MTRWLLACVALAGCGRVGFSQTSGPAADGGAITDGAFGDAAARTFDGASDGVVTSELCPMFATFCDGFESGSDRRWTGVVMPASQTVNTTHVHTGHYGYDADVPPAGGNGGEGAVYLDLSEQSSGTLAVREWVYAEQQIINYVGVLYFTASANPNGEYAEVIADDTGAWAFTEDSPVGMLHDHSSSTLTTTNQWTCVEIDLTLGSGGSFELFIDGTSALSNPYIDPDPDYDTVSVGVTRANAAGFELFVDDVVIANQHIGC